MYLIYNAVSNACTGTERPGYQNNRDFTPLQPLDDKCLKSVAAASQTDFYPGHGWSLRT